MGCCTFIRVGTRYPIHGPCSRAVNTGVHFGQPCSRAV